MRPTEVQLQFIDEWKISAHGMSAHLGFGKKRWIKATGRWKVANDFLEPPYSTAGMVCAAFTSMQRAVTVAQINWPSLSSVWSSRRSRSCARR